FKSKYHIDVDFEVPKKINWYYAPLFAAFWLILYLSIVVTQVDHLPKALHIKEEHKYPDRFISERAELTLIGLSRIGPKVVGSVANEVTAVEFLKNEISKIQQQASDYFEFEIDVQIASGSYMHWSMVNMYQSIQNVVVKLKAKDSTSDKYVLMNSHFDSVPGSPGAGDDGSMVSVMLEVMRVISKSNGPLKHPIVFLFNGAEENPLQASHAFITQHKWAKNCKALINLDAAGSGGRELLFQSGPENPWLMRYYRKVPHPFATTMGEEIFQAGLIPSDTDFRIFRDYGNVPGLDIAYVFHGYVYHTEYDRINILIKESLQNTGDNILVLAKGIANAPEMDDLDNQSNSEGHVIFYDFLGWFIVFYTENTGVIINIVVCLIALCAIGFSLYFMSARSGLGWPAIFTRFGICFAIQMISLVLAAGLTILEALFLDAVDRSMSWYYSYWLLIGLYFCPMFFGMGILPAVYLEKTKRDPLSLGFRIQLFMHSHCLFLIILTLVLTGLGIRTSFMCMLAVLFDISALVINLITKWHRRAYWFAIATVILQILPFIYYTSIAHALYMVVIPMSGRAGSTSIPDVQMCGLAIFFTVLFAGVIMPLFLFFRKTRTIICTFLLVNLVFIIMAVTPAGFPYKAKLAPQRFSLLHAERTLYDANGNVRLQEAGIYIYPQDRRIDSIDDFVKGVGQKHAVSDYCETEMFCGMPLYNHRWHKSRDTAYWIPVAEAPILPTAKPVLTLKTKTDLVGNSSGKRYEFELQGPDHMTIFIDLKEESKIIDWSFNDTMLKEKWEKPYFIYFSYGKDNSNLIFHIDIEKPSGNYNTPSLEIGIGGHWIHQEVQRTSWIDDACLEWCKLM
ncbi:hypothetical protein DOY81_000297, partial [Sarcophaga bullata]